MLRRPLPPRGPLNKSAPFILSTFSSVSGRRHASQQIKVHVPVPEKLMKLAKPERAPDSLGQYFSDLERDRSRNWVSRPPEGFNNVAISDKDLKLDATRVYQIYCAYRKAELQNVKNRLSITWKRQFVKDHHIALSLLYDIALHMLRTPRSPADGGAEDWNYATRLMQTAAELGHRPAVLELVRRIITTRSDAAALSREFPELYTSFRRIVAEGRDPDAQTLQGLLHAKQGDETRALACLQKAKDLGAGKPFFFKPLCLARMGTILEKQGKRELAESEYAELARENDGLGFYHLGLLYKTDPIAKWLLQKAASSGLSQAMRELGKMELEDYKKATEDGDQAAAQRHIADSQEWHRLAKVWGSTSPPTHETY
ncbi:hypothetical protein SODALDRAFT_329863 [Sodiomyces alkalinus F11]|uniref:HCP-like protein n=1 Tax=Sodiomyces alkalinus (strain CBS 110278 / VKM F-3762 / F11) TaxID=1314773 RepID=A0A3N2Q0B5_SODAK|nr:hypothetical protein SODALDRAFT_329863 [Sodiomyces alkalinus F11]ROT40190.1 hypothetical protein SODALDRAFT_329863 [Sodiomyces alkalinus F11]